MIEFSTLQGLTIPEGVVTQIAKDGVVLWSGESKDCKVSIKWISHNVGSFVTIGGTKYSSRFMSLSKEVVVPSGTEITVTSTAVWSAGAEISFNGTIVKQVDKTNSVDVDNPIEYTFVTQKDTSIEFTHNVDGKNKAYITES